MVYQTWKGVSSNLFERAGETSRISKNSDRPVLGGGKEENFVLGRDPRKQTHHLHNERSKRI